MNAPGAAPTLAERRGVLRIGNLEIDQDSYRVRVAQQFAVLSLHEFDLLQILAENAGRIVPGDKLTLALWGAAGHNYLRRLSVLVYRLRAKLAGSSPYQVTSIRRRGYGLLQDADPAGPETPEQL